MLAAALLLLDFSFWSAAQSVQASQPTRTFLDRASHLSFDYPANWTFAEQDHEISTFHLDARTAPRNDRVRAVIAMPENPYPASTFSGAYLYFSVTPHSSATACARQAVAPKLTPAEADRRASEARAAHRSSATDPPGPSPQPAIPLITKPDRIEIAGITFTHGRDEQREVCLTQHDDVYTTYRAGACLRFDLAINNFCGAAANGAHDLTAAELDQLRAHLMDILKTVRINPK